MYLFDKVVIDFVLKELPHSHSFYEVVLFISDNNLLKGGVLILLIWYLWFRNTGLLPDKKINIIATLFSAFAAMVISRVITFCVPFQNRPILNQELTYFPFETDTTSIDKMSSFPSDHASLFISLAMGLLFVSKRAGILALLYTSFFILFPRVYLGYHYPTDIVAGAFIGIVASILFNRWKLILNIISNTVIKFSKKYPQWFYPLFFLISFQIVVLFNDLRGVASFISHLL